MNLRTKHLKPLGFKGTGMWTDAAWHHTYYRSFPEANTVIGIVNLIPSGVFKFKLSPDQMKAFTDGKLSLIPPGCCHASGGRAIESYSWLHEGSVKDLNHLRTILSATGLFPETNCADCGHPQSNHYRNRGACNLNESIIGNRRVFVCACKRFRVKKL